MMHRLQPLVRAIVAVVAFGAAHLAAALPPRGSDAPPIALTALDGKAVSSADFANRPMVLLFGELNHDGVKRASADLLAVLAESKVAAEKPVAMLIIAQEAPPEKLKEEAAAGAFPSIILQDTKRDAFAAYHIMIVPSVVVIDTKGKVVHAMPGFLPRFREIIAEAILVAAGKKTEADLDRVLDPTKATAEAPSERVVRLVNLGRQLTQHGLYEMAQARFTEALAAEPGNVAAQLGLAELLMKQDRLADAEPLYREMLTRHPDSNDAALGMAALQIRRATGDDIAKAEATLKEQLSKDMKVARTHYLMGQIYEKRGELPQAVASYRRAAELAMDGIAPPVGTITPAGG